MRLIFKLLSWLCLVVLVSLGAFVWFSFQDQPVVENSARLSHQDIARARKIIRENDPRNHPANTTQTVSIAERDADLAANYLLQQLSGSARVSLDVDNATLAASWRVHKAEIKSYLNVTAQVISAEGKPELSQVQIGSIMLPDVITQFIVNQVMARVLQREEGQLLSNAFKGIAITRENVAITYLWQPELVDKFRKSLAGTEHSEAMAAFYNHLAELQSQGIARRGSLADALQPLFELADQRSIVHDPIVENQALLFVLGSWAVGRGMDQLVDRSERAGRIGRFALTLENRVDFAQHFLVSAALAAASDTTLSHAVGIFKEVQDSDGRSGFSFTDLAADLAGTRFGQLATESIAGASKVQENLAAAVKETDIIPGIKDLPEGLSATEFASQYGEVDSRAYREVVVEIERRLTNCRLYQ